MESVCNILILYSLINSKFTDRYSLFVKTLINFEQTQINVTWIKFSKKVHKTNLSTVIN